MENEFNAYLDNLTVGEETTWFTTPPFDVIKEVSEASDEILSRAYKKLIFKLSAEECTALTSAIRKYAKDRETDVYDKLPGSIRTYIKVMHEKMVRSKDGKGMSMAALSRMMLEQLINDISIDVVFAKLEQDQFTMAKEQYETTEQIFADIFNKRADLEAETPGVGDAIDSVKDAFAEADNFEAQFQYLIGDSPHNVKRYHRYYNSEMVEFNKRCSQSKFALVGVKDYLQQMIKTALPKPCTTDEAKAFIVLLIRSLQSRDLNHLGDSAYVHRLFDLMYRYRYLDMDDRGKQTFADIARVIDRYRIIVGESFRGKKKKGRK